ncbi:unnamed protein product [Spirodela intermedia]|uniref:Uncharacterized protein n=1 Tax=Spirodela intermedia TaxID=51605 RepID=A0A7I8J2D2_SPIIN|nr:unnamed protein product [Spirodela intermedia]CAA6664132.1 unnamed protein product [Spirodela intermedia]
MGPSGLGVRYYYQILSSEKEMIKGPTLWRRMQEKCIEIRKCIKWEVGNGKVNVWKDCWSSLGTWKMNT